jgi:hypothetical protein
MPRPTAPAARDRIAQCRGRGLRRDQRLPGRCDPIRIVLLRWIRARGAEGVESSWTRRVMTRVPPASATGGRHARSSDSVVRIRSSFPTLSRRLGVMPIAAVIAAECNTKATMALESPEEEPRERPKIRPRQ